MTGSRNKSNAQRRRQSNVVAISQVQLEQLIKHFQIYGSIPMQQNKFYLANDLTEHEMFSIYRDDMRRRNFQPVAENVFMEFVRLHFPDLSFNQSKNHCPRCSCYRYLPENLKNELSEDYEEHQRTIGAASSWMNDDIKSALSSDAQTACLQIDYERSLEIPCRGASKRIQCYKLTILDTTTKQVTTYLWPEWEGRRDGAEMATCVYNYLTEKLDSRTKKVFIYCIRNQKQFDYSVIGNAMWSAMLTNPDIDSVYLKFLVAGHSEMEVDSVYSKIQTSASRQNDTVYWLSDWYWTLRRAGVNNVELFRHDDFIDFATSPAFAANLRSFDRSDQRPAWNEGTQFRIQRSSMNFVQVKKCYDDSEDWTSFFVPFGLLPAMVTLQKAYKATLPISQQKKIYLIVLLLLRKIPESDRSLVESLVSSEDSASGSDNRLQVYINLSKDPKLTKMVPIVKLSRLAPSITKRRYPVQFFEDRKLSDLIPLVKVKRLNH